MEKRLREFEICEMIETVQMTAQLKSARILRRVLTTEEIAITWTPVKEVNNWRENSRNV